MIKNVIFTRPVRIPGQTSPVALETSVEASDRVLITPDPDLTGWIRVTVGTDQKAYSPAVCADVTDLPIKPAGKPSR